MPKKKQSKNVLFIKAAQKRIQRLNKAGLHPSELGILQANLSIFYNNLEIKPPTNVSGISLRGLSTKDIQTLKKIVNPFMRSKKTTASGIKEAYRAELEKIKSKLGTELPKEIEKGLKDKQGKISTKSMLNLLENTQHVKASAIAKGMIYSEQIKMIYDAEKDGDIDREQSEALINMLYEMTVDGEFDDIDTDLIRKKTQQMLDEEKENKEKGWKDFGHW